VTCETIRTLKKLPFFNTKNTTFYVFLRCCTRLLEHWLYRISLVHTSVVRSLGSLFLPLEGLKPAPLRRLAGSGGGVRGLSDGSKTPSAGGPETGKWPIDSRSFTDVDRATGADEPETAVGEIVKPEVGVALAGFL